MTLIYIVQRSWMSLLVLYLHPMASKGKIWGVQELTEFSLEIETYKHLNKVEYWDAKSSKIYCCLLCMGLKVLLYVYMWIEIWKWKYILHEKKTWSYSSSHTCTMFTSVLENVHTLHRRGAFLNWSSSLLHLLRIL